MDTDSSVRELRDKANSIIENFTAPINEIVQLILAALQATVQRADKVYEGVKKIIDAKSREFNYDNKPGSRIGS